MRKLYHYIGFFTLSFLLLFQASAFSLSLVPQRVTVNGSTIDLRVPSGLKVEFLATLSSPRLISIGPDGELLIGSRGRNIYRAKAPYSKVETLVNISGLNQSVSYRNGRIYVAETGGLHSAPYTGASTSLTAADFSLITSLPSATGGHSTRTVITGPDNRLYISLGISGNCSDEYVHNSYPFERRRGGVFILDETGTNPVLKPFSSGLRNPIGLAFHPTTNTLYATNAGPDNLGFDQPPEAFAPLSEGSFHGMPWFQFFNGTFRSGECTSGTPPRAINEATAPSAFFAARSTPIGVTFVTTPHLGRDFQGNSLVAIHGSWAKPPGGDNGSRRPPKVSMVVFENNIPSAVEDVVTGFQRSDGSRFARPAGVAIGSDGNLYFTSDGGDVRGLFRLTPVTPRPPPPPPPGKSISSTYILLLK